MATVPADPFVRLGDPLAGNGMGRMVAPVEPIAPMPGQNQFDREGQRTRAQDARDIFNDHVKGLQARRDRDLISEKLLLHIDGSGDFQWADIYDNVRVEIPRFVSEYRKQENVLRLIVDNAISHHTTSPLRYFAESGPDRRARERAMMDMLWANYLAVVQHFNDVFSDALYLAMPAGFSPVHGYWRDDVAQDWYENLYSQQQDPDMLFEPLGSGMIDVFPGNPWDTVFDPAATRDSIRWSSYGRIMDGDLFRQVFGHVPEARNLEGSEKIPSAAEFQRMARDWRMEGLGLHGSPIMNARRDGADLITVICRETAPGVLTDHPDGRLQIIGVPGNVDTRRGEGSSSKAVIVADQPLPGRDFSFSLFYSHHRGSDIHGKPWVEDIDQLQVDLNIALSRRWEVLNKMIEAPIVAPGGAIGDDMAELGGYNLLEVEPSLASWTPRVMQWPSQVIDALNREIEDLRRAIYTGGGYQAVSRGEAPGSRTAYRAIVALQQADNTIHSPVNNRFRKSAIDFMGRCWSQMKMYGDVPWLIDIVGDEYTHLVEPYIDATKLSDRPPRFKLVNAFGASPELRAQEVLELMQTMGADGVPFMTTEEARRQYPNQQIFDSIGDPRHVKIRRAKTVARAFETQARQIRQQWGGYESRDPTDPYVQQAAQYVFLVMESLYPRFRDDDLDAHLNAYSEVVQDETADPIARQAIIRRQDMYYQWQAMMAAQAMTTTQVQQETGGAPAGNGRPALPGGSLNAQSVAQQMQGTGGEGGAMIANTAR